MALNITSENYKNNCIGMDNGGLQPSGNYTLDTMRLNNGAPTRKNGNSDEISYDNEGKENPWQDRVVSTDNGVTQTFTTARDGTYFALHGTTVETDIDNGTNIGDVTESGNFHYVGPQTNVTTDNGNYEWTKDGQVVEAETEGATGQNTRTSKINEIYMVGSVNAMSAR